MANAFSDLPVGYAEDGSQLDGAALRRGNLFATTGGAAGMSMRGGVRPSRGNPLGATLPGGMFVHVLPGVGVIPTATQGGYVVSVPAAVDLAVTSAHATQARIDTLGLEVVPGVTDLWRLRMLDGAPSAGTPVAPDYAAVGAAGGLFLPLYDIRVNAAVSAPTSITDRRTYTAAAGGVVPYPGLMALSQASRDTVAAGLPVGTPLYDDAAQSLQIVSASTTRAAGSNLIGQGRRYDINEFPGIGSGMAFWFLDNWVNLPAFANTVMVDVAITVISPNSSVGRTVAFFDNEYVIDEVYNTIGAGPRTLCHSFAVANKAAGIHGLCGVGLNVTLGGAVSVVNVMYAYRALG